MDTTAATTVGATVAVVVQLLKIAMPGLKGGYAVAVMGALGLIGMVAWIVSQPTLPDRTWVFGLFTGWSNITLTALATYGLIGGSGTGALTRGAPRK